MVPVALWQMYFRGLNTKFSYCCADACVVQQRYRKTDSNKYFMRRNYRKDLFSKIWDTGYVSFPGFMFRILKTKQESVLFVVFISLHILTCLNTICKCDDLSILVDQIVKKENCLLLATFFLEINTTFKTLTIPFTTCLHTALIF